MSWEVGDLALCGEDGKSFIAAGIFEGKTYEVFKVVVGTSRRDGPGTGLVLAGILLPKGKIGVNANSFRKIRPDEHEACETEFATLLRKMKAPAHA